MTASFTRGSVLGPAPHSNSSVFRVTLETTGLSGASFGVTVANHVLSPGLDSPDLSSLEMSETFLKVAHVLVLLLPHLP